MTTLENELLTSRENEKTTGWRSDSAHDLMRVCVSVCTAHRVRNVRRQASLYSRLLEWRNVKTQIG